MGLFGPPDVEGMKTKGDVKGLIKALGYRKNPEVAQLASLALVDFGAGAVESLIGAFGSDAAREAAIETLVQIGEPSVGPLVDALLHFEAHESAFKALDKIGKAAVELAVERYTASLHEADDDVLFDQIRALTLIGGPAVERLVAILTDRQVTSLHLREYVAGALGKIGDKRAVEALIRTLQEEDEFVRGAAAGALFQIGDDRAIVPMVSTLRDEDEIAQYLGGRVWALIGYGSSVKPLLADLVTPDAQSRVIAEETLTSLGWKRQSDQKQ